MESPVRKEEIKAYILREITSKFLTDYDFLYSVNKLCFSLMPKNYTPNIPENERKDS